MKPPSVMKSTGALSLPGVTPTTISRDASRPEGARMSSAVRWAARKLDAFAAARMSGSRSPNWAVTVGAGFMSAPTNTTSALPLGADRDPNATLTVPLITNAYPLFGFEDFGPTDAASLAADADISGGLLRSSISRRDWATYFSPLGAHAGERSKSPCNDTTYRASATGGRARPDARALQAIRR